MAHASKPDEQPGQQTTLRQDIRADRQRLQSLLGARDQGPLPGALVEIWHYDAHGHYADGLAEPDDEGYGEQAADISFLHGLQRGDERGQVRFDTIYPGWRRARSPHVQRRARSAGDAGGVPNPPTGQLYFPAAINARVSQLFPYRDRLVPATSLEDDDIHACLHGEQAIVKLEAKDPGLPHAGYIGRLSIAVDPRATTQVET